MALKECKECGKEVSSRATSCPHCGNPMKRVRTKSQPTQYGCGTLIFLGLISWFVYSQFLSPLISKPEELAAQLVDKQPAASNWKTENNRMMAYNTMKDFVKKQLKSPSTAKFPGVTDGIGDHVKPIGNQTYEINSWVDSQNAFGGTLRTQFKGQIKQADEHEWRLLSLEFVE